MGMRPVRANKRVVAPSVKQWRQRRHGPSAVFQTRHSGPWPGKISRKGRIAGSLIKPTARLESKNVTVRLLHHLARHLGSILLHGRERCQQTCFKIMRFQPNLLVNTILTDRGVPCWFDIGSFVPIGTREIAAVCYRSQVCTRSWTNGSSRMRTSDGGSPQDDRGRTVGQSARESAPIWLQLVPYTLNTAQDSVRVGESVPFGDFQRRVEP